MWEFLVFGTFWFWTLVTIAAILLIVATERGSVVLGTVTMVATLGLLFFLGNKGYISSGFSYLIHNPLHFVLGIAGYFAAGTGWSVVKWYFYLLKKRDHWKESYANFNNTDLRTLIPRVGEHKERITSWMIYWPFSATWTIFDSPVKRTFNLIYSKMQGGMQKMADKIFEPAVQELELEREKKKKDFVRG